MRQGQVHLESRYTEQARKTLYRGGKAGDSDPHLLVVRALFELEAGDRIAAERLFTQALAHDTTLRPRAYLELVRLKLERWQADNAGSDDPLPTAEAS